MMKQLPVDIQVFLSALCINCEASPVGKKVCLSCELP